MDLGITSNQNADFRLELDVSTLQAALAKSPGDVAALLADQKRASDDLIRFTRFQSVSKEGEYDVVIERLASQGTLAGQAVAGLAGLTTIDADNDTFALRVDGVSSQTITLSQGDYADGAALAQEISNQINADDNLQAAGIEVSVVYNALEERLEFTSSSFGSRSQIGVTAVDVNTTASFGLEVATGESTRGTDVAGTINGIRGSGAGQFLKSIGTGAGHFRSFCWIAGDRFRYAAAVAG